MLKIYENEYNSIISNKEKDYKYEIINNDNDDTINYKNNINSNKSLKHKIFNKYCVAKNKCVCYCILSIFIFFLFLLLISLLFNFNTKIAFNLFTITNEINNSFINNNKTQRIDSDKKEQLNNNSKIEYNYNNDKYTDIEKKINIKENESENNNKINEAFDSEINTFDDNNNNNENEKIIENEEFKQREKDIYKEEVFDPREISFLKAYYFLKKSLNGILINQQSFILSENPKVSVVIPIYNCRYIISRAIKSIQNQNLVNLEIILVDDFSTDDTLSYIEILQSEDPRIKLLKNKKNMGILYSRSIGTLSAKGKYIFPLDNDDMFLNRDVFQTITNIADKGNFDIVEFKGIISLLSEEDILRRNIMDISYSNHELNLVLFQPQLGAFPLIPANDNIEGYNITTVFLWGKCIKTKIYQKALNKLGKERYSRHMIRHEDVLATYIIFNTAESYKFVGKYGIFHIHRPDSASKRIDPIEINLYNLYLTDAVLDFSKDNIKNKQLEASLIISLLYNPQLNLSLNYRDYNYNLKLLLSCIDRILNSKYTSEYMKYEIKRKVKELDFLNYHNYS